MTKFIIIKAWGQGFWSDTAHALGCLLLAETTGRVPVMHWGLGSRYRRSSDPMDDVFGVYFKPPSDVSVRDLMERPRLRCFPTKWNDGSRSTAPMRTYASAEELASRDEEIIVSDYYLGVPDVPLPAAWPRSGLSIFELYRYLIDKYLLSQDELVETARLFCEANFGAAPFVALHLRGTDKGGELRTAGLLEAYNRRNIAELNAEVDQTWPVFVMSDSRELIDLARAELGRTRRVVTHDSLRSDGPEPPHTAFDDGYRLGRDILIETLVALRAAAFYGVGNSNVAGMIALLKPWQGRCSLLGDMHLFRRGVVRTDLGAPAGSPPRTSSTP